MNRKFLQQLPWLSSAENRRDGLDLRIPRRSSAESPPGPCATQVRADMIFSGRSTIRRGETHRQRRFALLGSEERQASRPAFGDSGHILPTCMHYVLVLLGRPYISSNRACYLESMPTIIASTYRACPLRVDGTTEGQQRLSSASFHSECRLQSCRAWQQQTDTSHLAEVPLIRNGSNLYLSLLAQCDRMKV